MARPVFLVGSVPYDADEVFERAGAALSGLISRIPDGEKKGWLPVGDFHRMADIVEGKGQSISGPPFYRTVRAAQGVDPASLPFAGLHYRPNAVESYAVFKAMKDAGRLPPDVRFQVSIPTPFTGLISWDWDQLRAVWPAYEAALLAEVARIAEEIPPSELAISWDVCEFVMVLANPHAPDRYTADELAAAVGRALDAVPAGAEAGLHFCYGGYNSAGTGEDPLNRVIEDTALMVDFFHAIRARTRRSIDWLHIPVPRQRDDRAFFAPLADLRLDAGTELYLGLVYLEDGLDGARRKMAAASEFVGAYGVAAACGLNNPGASSRPRTEEMLAHHRQVAELT